MRDKNKDMKDKTRLAHTGRAGKEHHGAVNPPIYHASTFLYENYAAITGKQNDYTYGRRGTPTTRALEEAMSALEVAHDTVLVPSGLSACTLSILSFVKTGDHVLISDSAYEPTKYFCDTFLARMGVELTAFDPRDVSALESLIKPTTSVIFMESPGSISFEISDVPAIVALAKAHNIITIMDNTWATPLFFKPLELGVDVSVQAATKYIVGHADALLGYISATKQAFSRIKEAHGALGLCAGPDDVRMGLRGLRTLSVRLQQHMQSALNIAQWLEQQQEVKRVIHPGLPSHPDHALWQRDFTGASGLFSIILHPYSETALANMLDKLTLFAMGFSWGGFESLIVPYGKLPRQAVPLDQWEEGDHLCRLHIGLEDIEDLKKDLRDGLDRLSATK